MSPDTERFIRYHHDNPVIFRLFSRFAVEALDAGMGILSASFIFERMRWEAHVVTRSGDGFKISNNFKPYYARLFEIMNPCYNGKFNNKSSEADELYHDDIKPHLVKLTLGHKQ